MTEPDHRVFECAVVENHIDGWLVLGLVFATIKVGDALTISEIQNKSHPLFKVASITTYGREIDEIDRGMTCRLVLVGDQGDLLQDAKYLYRFSSGD